MFLLLLSNTDCQMTPVYERSQAKGCKIFTMLLECRIEWQITTLVCRIEWQITIQECRIEFRLSYNSGRSHSASRGGLHIFYTFKKSQTTTLNRFIAVAEMVAHWYMAAIFVHQAHCIRQIYGWDGRMEAYWIRQIAEMVVYVSSEWTGTEQNII